jgi:hypothetical protein
MKYLTVLVASSNAGRHVVSAIRRVALVVAAAATV